MFPGLIICLLLGLLATWVGGLQHFVGAPIIGIILGALVANLLPARFMARFQKGGTFCGKRLLRAGIIMAGGTLSLKSIMGAGLNALPFIVFSMVLAFSVSYGIGHLIKTTRKTRILVGGGTAICGGTAIATLSAIINAEEDETAYAMTAIFLFDMIAALLWPYVAYGLGYSPEQFGLLAGVAINDVSSVTAAGDTYNALMGASAVSGDMSGGDYAMIVKLTRVAMLVVVAIIATVANQVAVHNQSKASADVPTSGKGKLAKTIIKAFPFYVLGFILLAMANTMIDFTQVNILGTSLAGLLKTTYKYLITVALVGVGFKVQVREIFVKGAKPVLLGGCTWAAVAICTLVYSGVFL